MKPLLFLAQPFDTVAAARVDIRVADALSADAFGLGGLTWLPAMETRPQISVDCMSLDLDGQVQAGRMTIGIAGAFALLGYKWKGSPVTLWACPNLEYVTRSVEFTGEVTDQQLDLETGVLRLTCQVSTSLIDKDMLTLEFTGAGGATGEAAMRGTLKPAGFGFVRGIEPVWFDQTNWIGMIDGYGNTVAIDRLLEGASAFSASVGDFVSYDDLATAIETQFIAPGMWGTCIAEGLVGLGAPPADGHPIGVDAHFGYGLLGSMMQRILTTHAGVAGGAIDSDAFDALDAAVPYPVHLWVKDQRNVQQVLETLAASGNATPIITPRGTITVSRGVVSAPVATLDRSGSSSPRVTDWKSAAPVAPFWQIKGRTARPANVLSFDQVNYADTLIDRGTYNPLTVYRLGNIVWLEDGSSWLYYNDVPTAGMDPVEGSLFWYELTGPKGGIVTNRYPTVPPTDVKIGSIYFDDLNRPWRLEGGPLEFDGDPLEFDGDPLEWLGYVLVQDQDLRSLITILQRVDDDGILTIDEKIRIVIPESARLEAIYEGVYATALSMSVSVTAMTAARGAWIALRDGLVPAWNDTTQDTPITRTDWDAVLDTYRNAIEDARKAVTTPGAVTVAAPPNQVVKRDQMGDAQAGEFPRVLTPTVLRGSNDIRDDDDVTYAISTSGVSASINNTLGDPDKGKISVTAAASDGYIDLTVTVAGTVYGPYPISFTSNTESLTITYNTAAALVLHYTSGGLTIIDQFGTGSLAANSTTHVDFPETYTTRCFAIATGGSNDPAREGDVHAYAYDLTGIDIINTQGVDCFYTWTARGF